MRKLVAAFLVFLFLLASAPVFAADSGTKAHPLSPFNIVNGWLYSLGEKGDGKWFWEFENTKPSLTAEELQERRDRVECAEFMRGIRYVSRGFP